MDLAYVMHTRCTLTVVLFFPIGGAAYGAERYHERGTKTIQIIGAGFSRTGTSSLMSALTAFGYNVYHGVHFHQRPQEWCDWKDAMRSGGINVGAHTRLLDRLVHSGFNAFLDSPASDIWEAQFVHSPKAKVILSVRDPRVWAESMLMLRNHPYIPHGGWWWRKPFKWIPPFNHLSTVMQIISANSCGQFPCGKEGDPLQLNMSMELMRNRTNCVQARVPASQLLIWDPSEGWGPLCQFLRVEICPNKSFPKVNQREAWKKQASQSKSKSKLDVLEQVWLPTALAIATIVVYGVSRCLGRLRKPRAPADAHVASKRD